MSSLLKIARNEPARVTAFVVALMGLLSAFGLGITSQQSGSIVSLVGSFLVLVGGEVVRSQVTPVAPDRATVHVDETGPDDTVVEETEPEADRLA